MLQTYRNRIIKHVSFIFLSLIFMQVTFAQPSQGDAQTELKNALSGIDTLSASFVQRVFDDNEEVYQASGKLQVAKPGKVRWQTEFPDESLMIADGTSIWNIDDFVEQITVFDQASTITNNPIILLTTEDEDAWSQFTISKVSTDEVNGTDITASFQIDVSDESAQIQQLTIHFADNAIHSILSLDLQGQVSQLTFADLVVNPSLSQELFLVTIPSHYTLDDQR